MDIQCTHQSVHHTGNCLGFSLQLQLVVMI